MEKHQVLKNSVMPRCPQVWINCDLSVECRISQQSKEWTNTHQKQGYLFKTLCWEREGKTLTSTWCKVTFRWNSRKSKSNWHWQKTGPMIFFWRHTFSSLDWWGDYVTTSVKIQSVHLKWGPTICGSGGRVLLKLLYAYVKGLEFQFQKTDPTPVSQSNKGFTSFRSYKSTGKPTQRLFTFPFMSLDIYYSLGTDTYLSYMITGIFFAHEGCKWFLFSNPRSLHLYGRGDDDQYCFWMSHPIPAFFPQGP